MKYYKNTNTGEVYAYEQSDIDKVEQINAGNAEGINPVFFKIRDNLANCTEMTPDEIEEHLNPTPTLEQLADEARAKRDGLLRELDAIVSNPLRWNDFTEEEQQVLADYRQALLDVPQQKGFPKNVIFPKRPKCLC